MTFNSITFKLLSFVIAALLLVTISVLAISYIQLRPIVDKSQGEIYLEKLDVIWSNLSRIDQKLQKTGLVEAYIDDFKNSAVSGLKNTYYPLKNKDIWLFILNEHGQMVMQPDDGASFLALHELNTVILNMTESSGQFTVQADANPTWFVYRQFSPWGWTLCYAVPLSVKYADVKKFITLLLITLVSIIFVIAFVLSLIITRLVHPITLLTNNAVMISGGNLDQPIAVDRTDEIGKLAQSFDHMRNSIKTQLEQLNSEIIERRKAEKELYRLRNYLSNIIDSMPSVLVGVDAGGKVTQWNKTAEKNTGITAETAYGQTLQEVFPEMSDQMDRITQAIEAREIKRITRNPHKTDRGIQYEDMTFYPLIANGVEGAVIRIDDVTKEYELEIELNHSRKMDAIGQLAGGVAHDFNNMLSGILGAVQLLKTRQIVPDEKSLQYISIIEKASMRAADLTGKLLAFGRKGKIVSTSLDVQTLIEDTVAILSRTIDKRISISVRKGAENTFLIGDSSALQNALLNIGINASHSMPEGGKIEIETKNIWLNRSFCEESTFDIEPGEYIEIEIGDSGCGIPPENLQKIFEPFFTTKETGQGAGLGLAAVYGTVKDHNGFITVASEVGRGTTFCLLLPSSELREHTVHQDAGIVLGSGTVLLVDDEDIIRTTGKHLLEEMGYTILLAENGQEAVNIFQQYADEIDLVLMDMVMPVMDGRAAIGRLREIDQNFKIIIASGFPRSEQGDGLDRYGIQGFIQKPYRASELSRLIAQTLKKGEIS
jgi:PAS domain S-box-containing protein